jgi:DNA-directed RNA polymerase subunit RPC12/RpoP
MDELEIEHECFQCSTRIIIRMAEEPGSENDRAVCPKCGKVVEDFAGQMVAIVEEE